MSPAVRWTGAVLLIAGLALTTFKVVRYELPLQPTEALGPWQVELTITVRGDGQNGRIRVQLPSNEDGQRIFDERATSDRLSLEILERDTGRIGVWSGWLEDVHEVVYRYRVQTSPVEKALEVVGELEEPLPSIRALYLRAHAITPSTAPSIRAVAQELDLPPPTDPVARIQKVFAFVVHEIRTVPSATDDVLLTLDRREGNPEGKEELLITLLRAVGIPSRLVRGLLLTEAERPTDRVWVEAWLDGNWIPLSAVEGWIGQKPADWIVVGRGNIPSIEVLGVRAAGHRYRALRSQLRPDEIASLMAPDDPVLSFLSLYRLPVGTQSLLKLLLLLPIGALVTALFRNLIGVRTYGTFMPALIALALRELSPFLGLTLVSGVLIIGVTTRFALERLRLLMVPRLSILLCMVVLCVTAIALSSASLSGRDWLSGTALPIVILTMWIERITITSEEEGAREAARRSFWSLVISLCILPIFQSEQVAYLVFTFPELVIAIMGILVWIGGYMGFRLNELLRFRQMVVQEPKV